MDFNFYRNFITVVEAGNISTAAKQLALVQPALSAQLKTIEKYYNIKLFKTTRGKRQIELTPAGEVFLQQAKQLCATEDNINLTMQNFNKKASGTLKFSVSYMRSEYFLQEYLIPFAQNNPQINYYLYNETATMQKELLLQGKIDFAFANAPLTLTNELTAIKIQQERFYLFFTDNFQISALTGTITPAQLASLPLCCNYGSYSLLRTVCKTYNFTPQIKFIATTAVDALKFAQSGLGVAVIASLPSDTIPKGMQRVLIDDDKLSFQQILYWKITTKNSLAKNLFLDFLHKKLL